MSPQLADYPRFAWQLLRGDRAAWERSNAEGRERDIAPYLDTSRRLRVLDLGNGRLRPQYAILRAQGHEVYGVDLANRPLGSWKDVAYRLARPIYASRLGAPLGSGAGGTLLCGDVGRLPLPDESFDLVTSVAAFEHFLDVPAVLAELARILRPGGVVWAMIHLFTSPSGGHNLSFTELPLRSVPEGVDAWDHLRKRRLPFTVPLNEWRAHQYREAFMRHFELLSEYCWGREGELLLTPEIEAELAGYSRDELTCATLVMVARKPAGEL
ncbi:MAG: hypothetical protein RLZZ387_2043 [Chloroflexota bacterium]|jgi:SAM-dependent methyltransferase